MELRQVEYFLGVARAGTFGRAAEELHVAKGETSFLLAPCSRCPA